MSTISKIMKSFMVVLALVAVTLAIYQAKMGRSQNQPKTQLDYGTVAAFKLIDQKGKPFGSEDLQGHPWVANFIFTRCQGPCPMIAVKTAQLQKEFSEPQLRFVSFSVDPEYDTAKKLAEYASVYGAGERWSFLTGSKKDIYELIRGSFKLAVEKNPGDDINSAFIHSMHFVLIDGSGRIRGYYNSGDPEDMGRLRADLPSTFPAVS